MDKYVRDNSHAKYEAYTKEDINEMLLNKVYPVGSIYMSINELEPSDLFGGTWEQIKDTFLLSAGDTYQAGFTGGEATHTLTVNEMPSHGHTFRGVNDGTSVKSNYGSYPARIAADKAPNWTGYFIDNTGGSQAHNNMPPYLTVYMWKRIA